MTTEDTERRVLVVNTPASYSGGSGFKSWLEDWLFRLRVFFGECGDSTSKLDDSLVHIFSYSTFTYLSYHWTLFSSSY
jgi:hypothetical protein